MAANSAIQWTDATWNPTAGCALVSPGCTNCYAMRDAWRLAHNPNPKIRAKYAGTVRKVNGKAVWTGKVNLDEEALLAPLRWRKPRRVFVDSMSDLFHESVPDDWIDRVFAVMALSPEHTYQVLTKRPERMRRYLMVGSSYMERCNAIGRAVLDIDGERMLLSRALPLPNVWLGTSVEDQKRAEERIPALLDTPAAVRFLSCEPLLGPIDIGQFVVEETEPAYRMLSRHYGPNGLFDETGSQSEKRYRIKKDHGLHWLIVGGESGPRARPFDIAWARALMAQCAGCQVPFFMKQLGSNPYNGARRFLCGDRHGGDPEQWPEDLRVRAFPSVCEAGETRVGCGFKTNAR